MTNIAPVLQIKNLTLWIKKRALLEDVSLSVESGKILGIIGPNGAGKTTLLRAIGGEFSSHNGEIFIAGKALKQWPGRQLACCLSSLAQQNRLNFPFTVQEVVSMSRLPHDSGLSNDRATVAGVMDKLDIGHLVSAVYTHLSGGEKQRVQLARVIAQLYPLESPTKKLLLLDEPCTGLDLKHQLQLAEYLGELSRAGVCVLMSAHDINWAASVSNLFLALKDGKVLVQGKSDEVLREKILKELFDVSLRVIEDDAGDKKRVQML